jgi:hypothetical protein
LDAVEKLMCKKLENKPEIFLQKVHILPETKPHAVGLTKSKSMPHPAQANHNAKLLRSNSARKA